MLALFLSSLTLGIAISAPPGVITAEAVRRGLAHGYWPALWVEMGSLVGDVTWAVIALAGAAILVENLMARLLLGLLGTLFLLYLAWSSLRDARQGTLPAARAAGGHAMGRNDFATGALLSLGNPFELAFWLGVGTSTLYTSIPVPQRIHYLIFLGAFILGASLWGISLAGIITWGRRFLRPAFFRWINLACSLLFGYFGLRLLWSTLLHLPPLF